MSINTVEQRAKQIAANLSPFGIKEIITTYGKKLTELAALDEAFAHLGKEPRAEARENYESEIKVFKRALQLQGFLQ